jgi:hypothetical protein
MKENKLGRKYANTWSSPPRIRSKGNHRFFTRMANKGVRKNARLMVREELAGEWEKTYRTCRVTPDSTADA